MLQRQDPEWVIWPVSWSAIWVGALTALAIGVLIGLIGLAVGANEAAQYVDWKKVDLIGLIFSVGGAFFGYVAGGWAAARIAGRVRSEPAILHGAIVWLVRIPLLADPRCPRRRRPCRRLVWRPRGHRGRCLVPFQTEEMAHGRAQQRHRDGRGAPDRLDGRRDRRMDGVRRAHDLHPLPHARSRGGVTGLLRAKERTDGAHSSLVAGRTRHHHCHTFPARRRPLEVRTRSSPPASNSAGDVRCSVERTAGATPKLRSQW